MGEVAVTLIRSKRPVLAIVLVSPSVFYDALDDAINKCTAPTNLTGASRIPSTIQFEVDETGRAKTILNSPQVKCWHCDLKCSKDFIFVPTTVRESGSVVGMKVEGCFCSWPCVLAYVYNTNTALKADTLRVNLASYFKCAGPKDALFASITRAPPRTERVEYGGNLSEQDYIHLLESCGPTAAIEYSKMVAKIALEHKLRLN